MSTPQRSRYPRPLKAMHTFAGGSSGQAQGGSAGQPGLVNGGGGASPSGSVVASTPTAAAAAATLTPFKNGHSSPPPPTGNGVRRCLSSPERRSPVSCNRGEVREGGSHSSQLAMLMLGGAGVMNIAMCIPG